MRTALLLALLAPSLARADASAPGDGHAAALRCPTGDRLNALRTAVERDGAWPNGGSQVTDATRTRVLIASSPRERAWIVDRDTPRVHLVPAAATTIVEGPGERLEGFLGVDPIRDSGAVRVRLLDDRGAARWTTTLPGWFDSASALSDGKSIWVALYDRIDSGSQLYAFDAATGKTLWRADVEQLLIGHSEYWNEVQLTRSGGLLRLVGNEAGGCYVQEFDEATGARRAARLRRSW